VLHQGDVLEGSFLEGMYEHVLVVSGDARNAHLNSVLVTPIEDHGNLGTATGLGTAVELGDGEPVEGVAFLDYIHAIPKAEAEAAANLGSVTIQVRRQMGAAILLVFGL
jgi:mRNA-degrading endonuclease toxin of MazEF toxin-antitoxin module